MLRFGSLRARIVLFTTVPLITLLAVFLVSTLVTATRAVRSNVRKSLADAGSVVVQLVSTRKGELATMARVTARDPRFFAPFSIPLEERGPEFGPTLEELARDFLRITGADFLEIVDAGGHPVARVGRAGEPAPPDAADGAAGLREALTGSAVTDFYVAGRRLVVAAAVPVVVNGRQEAVLRIGAWLDESFVHEVKRLTGAELSLVHDGRELVSTLPPLQAAPATLAAPAPRSTGAQESVAQSEAFTLRRGDTEYLSLRIQVSGVEPDAGFDAIVARELRAQLAPILTLEKRLALGGLAGVLLTLLVGYAVARSITGPLSSLVQAAGAIERGDYDAPVDVAGHDEVAALGRSVESMRRSLGDHIRHLKNIDQTKSNFIALAGHELKTPLTIISGFNDLIGSGALGEIPASIQETSQCIKGHLMDLNQQVQNMLDLSAFEQGLQDFDFAAVELGALARSAAALRERVLGERKLTLELEPAGAPVHARADRERLEQAFLCLLDNAIRFTPDGGRIRVHVGRGDGLALLGVEDSGVGIPPGELQWIFQKLYEAGDIMHHSSGKHAFGSRGFGLGLALCKAIVDLHGGRIDVRSAPGRGSHFTLALPGAAQPAQDSKDVEPEEVLL